MLLEAETGAANGQAIRRAKPRKERAMIRTAIVCLSVILAVTLMGATPGGPALAGDLQGKDRQDFINSYMPSCRQSQHNSEANKKLGITAQQIESYCRCGAEGMADRVTFVMLRQLAANGNKLTQEMIDLSNEVTGACARKVLQN
ncbi:MAG: hypothetical protein Kow0032_08290 [Methyloligellaceae bacterium]